MSGAIPRYSPWSRSMMSKAREPASTTFIISRLALCRSAARNTSSRFLVLAWTASFTFILFPSDTTSAISRSDSTSPLDPSMFFFMSLTRRRSRCHVALSCRMSWSFRSSPAGGTAGISISCSDSER